MAWQKKACRLFEIPWHEAAHASLPSFYLIFCKRESQVSSSGASVPDIACHSPGKRLWLDCHLSPSAAVREGTCLVNPNRFCRCNPIAPRELLPTSASRIEEILCTWTISCVRAPCFPSKTSCSLLSMTDRVRPLSTVSALHKMIEKRENMRT